MNTSQLDEQFLSYYQLSHDPFAARVPNFKFFSAQRKTILGQMHHLARHSQLMLMITGPKDSGKTLLRQALIASLNKDIVKIVNVSAKDCTSPSQVITVLADELKLAEATPEMIIGELNKLAEKDINLYLMIDDAEALSEDTLQLLLNLTSEQLKSFHIFLFARPALLEKLEGSTLGKEVTFNLPLTPYTLEETKEYLTLRLEGVGQRLALFSDEQLFDIYTQSGGWPGVINQVAKELLLSNMEDQAQEQEQPLHPQQPSTSENIMSFDDNKKDDEPSIGSLFTDKEDVQPDSFFAIDDEKTKKKAKSSGFIPKKHLVIAAIVAIVLLGIIFFSGSSKKTTDDKDNNVVADHYATLADNETQTTDLPLTTGTEALPTGTTNGASSLPLTTNNDTVPTTDFPVVTNTEQNTTLSTPPQNNNVTTTTPVTEPTATVTTAPTEQPVQTKPATITKPAAEPVKTQKTTQSAVLGTAWYKKQAGSNYTIQVSVASNEKSAQDFIKRQAAGDYHYYKRSRSGKVDYVITYGSYSGRTLAQNAVKKLPQSVQSSKPWVRSFSSIKAELAK